MIGVIDYGMGNLESVVKAFATVGCPARVVVAPDEIGACARLVLPGVGAFGRAMENLRERGMVEPILASVAGGIPLLGICLGLQLLFDESEEHGRHAGLGLIPGRVRRLPDDVKVPHMGWNRVERAANHRLLEGVPDGAYVYFAQSYFVEPEATDSIVATTEHGVRFPSIVARGNVCGVQFHPEKSQRWGLRMLANFGGPR